MQWFVVCQDGEPICAFWNRYAAEKFLGNLFYSPVYNFEIRQMTVTITESEQ